MPQRIHLVFIRKNASQYESSNVFRAPAQLVADHVKVSLTTLMTIPGGLDSVFLMVG